jgi:hypothetical protein
MISPYYNYTGHRNSYTELNEIYFWTITINNWNHLLKKDDNKMIVISSLQWLVQNRLVEIYGYVNYAQSHSFGMAATKNEWERVSEK